MARFDQYLRLFISLFVTHCFVLLLSVQAGIPTEQIRESTNKLLAVFEDPISKKNPGVMREESGSLRLLMSDSTGTLSAEVAWEGIGQKERRKKRKRLSIFFQNSWNIIMQTSLSITLRISKKLNTLRKELMSVSHLFASI